MSEEFISDEEYFAESADFKDELRNPSFKDEKDIKALAIKPDTKLGYEISKSKRDGVNKTGFMPTGLTEGNTVDMATANLNKNGIALNESANGIIALLKNVYKQTGINPKPLYDLVLEGRDLRNTLSKADNGKLLDLMFINKSEQKVSKGEINIEPPREKSKISRVADYFGGSE